MIVLDLVLATMVPVTVKVHSVEPIVQSALAQVTAHTLVSVMMVCATATPDLRVKTAQLKYVLMTVQDMVFVLWITSHVHAMLVGLVTTVPLMPVPKTAVTMATVSMVLVIVR
jgi:hypothetical protein